MGRIVHLRRLYRDYLSKSTCKSGASKYTKATGLSQMRIAKEIYAHTKMYYASSTAIASSLVCLVIGGMTAKIGAAATIAEMMWIRSHANPIDLGGDSDFRVSVYNAIWAIMGGTK